MSLLAQPVTFLFLIQIGLALYAAWTDWTKMQIFNNVNICIFLVAVARLFLNPATMPSLNGILIGIAAFGLARLVLYATCRLFKVDETKTGEKFGFPAAAALTGVTLVGALYLGSQFLTVTAGDVNAFKDLAAFAATFTLSITLLFSLLRFGAGDVKFLGVMALWFGWEWTMTFLLIAGALGGVLAILTAIAVKIAPFDQWNLIDRYVPYLKIGKGRTIPYGVGMSAAAIVVMFWQAQAMGVI